MNNIKCENNTIDTFQYFSSIVYTTQKPEFLKDAKEACNKALAKKKKEKKIDDIYPVYMTENLFEYKGMNELNSYIAQTSWNILNDQGYDMIDLSTFFTEFWCQEHHKTSDMRHHVHGFGSQIIGFYFVDVPKNSSRIIFHDPRPGKVQINLPESNVSNITPASVMINFEPKEGMMLFTNSWLPHSFSRHAGNQPIRFIHFNLTVGDSPKNYLPSAAEVI
jgi:uncharacterized protein (TIGR02466 family)